MGKYIYKVLAVEDGYCFRLYPSNNHKQPIGTSIVYPTRGKSEAALQVFRESGTLYQEHPELITIDFCGNRFFFRFCGSGGDMVFTSTKGTESRDNSQKSVQCVLRNLQAEQK